MTHSDIVNALQTLRPGAEWNLRGDTLDSIEWIDQNQVRPTDDDIIAAIAAYVPPVDPITALQNQVTELQTQLSNLIATQSK